MPTRIRKATKRDLRALVELSTRTILNSYPAFLGHASVEAYVKSGAVERYVRENLAGALVLLEADTVIGYAVPRGNLLDLLMIDCEYHGAGYGSILLEHVERLLFGDHEAIRLESFETNDRANRFYRKHGWHQEGRLPHEPGEPPKVLFQKRRPAR